MGFHIHWIDGEGVIGVTNPLPMHPTSLLNFINRKILPNKAKTEENEERIFFGKFME